MGKKINNILKVFLADSGKEIISIEDLNKDVVGKLFKITKESKIWKIKHNLKNTTPHVSVYIKTPEDELEFIYPNEVNIVNANKIEITFTCPIKGIAAVLVGRTELE